MNRKLVLTVIVKTSIRPSLNSGILVTRSTLTVLESNEGFGEVVSSGLIGIVLPPGLCFAPHPFTGVKEMMLCVGSAESPFGVSGNSAFQLSLQFPADWKREAIWRVSTHRLDIAMLRPFHNTIDGDAPLAFQSSVFASNACHRHIECTRTLSAVLQANFSAMKKKKNGILDLSTKIYPR